MPLPPGERRTHYRWVICALLFFATTVIYVDRQVLGILAPGLESEFGWTHSNYSFIVNSFVLAYAIGYSLVGRMMDAIGERKGFITVFCIWSLTSLAHGLIGPLVYRGGPWLNAVFGGALVGILTPAILAVAGFSVVRFTLGLIEGGHFPGAVKTVGQWHPKRERALATGIFNSGSNVGAVVAAYAVPFVVVKMNWGWASAFYLTGTLGFIWVTVWWLLYDRPERHPRVSPSELDRIHSDPSDPPEPIPWLQLLRHRQTWAYTLGMLLTSPIWWFYLYWLPMFLKNKHGIDIQKVFLPLLTVYLMADVGSIGGGAFSSWLLRLGASLNVARKSAFLLCACCAVPVALVARVSNMWIGVFLVGLAAAAHAGFAANLYTIVSDTIPRKALSSVVGIGGTAAGLGMLVLSTSIGYILDWTKAASGKEDYQIPFIIAGSAYLIATAVIHLLLPRLEVMTFDTAEPPASNRR